MIKIFERYKTGLENLNRLRLSQVLDMNLNPTESESSLFTQSLIQKINLCFETNSIFIGTGDYYWLELKRWPLLFKLAQVLIENPGFVSKEKIASFLWPDQKYLPRSTDPKIYDIVRRLKGSIDFGPGLPLLIESGESGYKIELDLSFVSRCQN